MRRNRPRKNPRQAKTEPMDLNHTTGGSVDGWSEVQQAILTILSTPIGSRVFRRDFGSNVPDLIDAPMTQDSILALYVAVAEALELWEPRFELTDVDIRGAATGQITLTLIGNHLPRAHLGDPTTITGETQTLRILRDRVDNWSLSA